MSMITEAVEGVYGEGQEHDVIGSEGLEVGGD
jgi:hypothetical protein